MTAPDFVPLRVPAPADPAPAETVRPVLEPEAAEPAVVVGSASDHAERHADDVAEAVLARLDRHRPDRLEPSPGPTPVRRSAAPAAGGGPAVVGLAGGALDGGLSARISAARGRGGRALSGEVRDRMEAGFGTSLGSVRIHDDAEAAALNRAVAARAFTTGNDIFFGAGEFQPGTADGERVLAHEVAHTRQDGN